MLVEGLGGGLPAEHVAGSAVECGGDGFDLFVNKGRCVSCHTVEQTTALFTDNRFHNIGVGVNKIQDDVDELAKDTRIIRNRRKIEATIGNAERILEIEDEHGSVGNYLKSLGDFESQWKAIKQEFKFMGGFGTYYFLYVVGEEVPDHEEFRATHL